MQVETLEVRLATQGPKRPEKVAHSDSDVQIRILEQTFRPQMCHHLGTTRIISPGVCILIVHLHNHLHGRRRGYPESGSIHHVDHLTCRRWAPNPFLNSSLVQLEERQREESL